MLDAPAQTSHADASTANDNAPPSAWMIPIVGQVGDGGRVRLNAAWAAATPFPNDHREA